jgi:hypothetical protein
MKCHFTESDQKTSPALKSFIRFFAVALFNLVLFAGIGQAQNTVTGAFQGDVSSRTGEIVTTAVVVITNIETGTTYNLTTDSQGRFYQGLLAPGFYTIQVTAPGFRTQLLRREIKVSLTGDVVPVPVRLEPEPPVVPGATPVPPPTVAEEANNIRVEINTSDGRRDGSFREEELRKLPLGGTTVTRTFDELALLLPGVAPPPQTIGDVAGPGVGPGVGSAGQFSANGLRSRGNNFTVDGSDNNDEDIGVRRQGFVALTSQPIESVQEYQVITLLAPAQFGRNIGAQVNAVSKQGSTQLHGALYGFFNSSGLNARNFFDTTNGNGTSALRTANGQTVLLDGQPLQVRNQTGGEDSFSFGQAGGVLGGAIIPNRLYYFLSGEYQKINATREKSFAVPTVEQRGAFGTGATGISTNFFNNSPLQTPLFPVNFFSNGVFSLFPFANNPTGIYGANTFTQTLPSSGRGTVFSGRLDDNFELGGKQQRLTGRYNFTDDDRQIPSVNESIFSTLLSEIRTQNVSLFLNSQLNNSTSGNQLFNQVRVSFGRTRLNFDEIRDTEFLIPSDELPNTPFLLNARTIFNTTLPQFNGQARFSRTLPPDITSPATTEFLNGPLGQVIIAGFSPLGVDVYNFPQNRVNNTYQLADELTRRSSKHVAVFGADIRRTDLISNLPRLSRTLLTFNGSPRLVPRTGNQCPNGGPTGSDFCFLPTGDPRAVIRPEDLAALGAASNSLLTLNVDRPDSKVNLRFYQLNFYGQDTWRISPELSLSYGLRYEYNTPVKEVNSLIEETFSDERLSLVPVLDRLVNNRSQLYESDYNNFAPRIGVAYSRDIFGGNRLSVFRGGYGIFYDQILGAVANQSKNVFPTFLTLNFGGLQSFAGQTLGIINPASFRFENILLRQPGTINSLNSAGFNNAGATFADVLFNSTFLFPNSINVTLPTEKLEMPMAHHYSFTFEQQLNTNLSFSVGYVGTSGRHLLRFTTPNLGSSSTIVPTGFDSVNQINAPTPLVRGAVFVPRRPLDRFDANGFLAESLGAVNQFETTASSTYNSLQTQLLGRFASNLNFRLSYTLSKVTDDVSDVFDLAGASVLPQNSFDLEAERGPANFDVRNRFAYNLVYNFSKNDGSGFLGYLTDDLQISSAGRFHSGQPFTVNSVIDVNLDGNLTDRLNTTQGIERVNDGSQSLSLATNNTTSLLAPFGQDGQVGRNSFRAGNVFELDLSVLKPFVFGTQRLIFRTDIFNFTNRANFGIPVRLLEAPGFGKATNTVTPGRRVQFSLKYEF